MCPYLASFRQADNDDGDGDASENDSCGSLGVAPLNVIPSLSSDSDILQRMRLPDGDKIRFHSYDNLPIERMQADESKKSQIVVHNALPTIRKVTSPKKTNQDENSSARVMYTRSQASKAFDSVVA